MTLFDLWKITPRCFIFIRNPDETVTLYEGSKALASRQVLDVYATEYPMYKNVLEVKIANH